MWLGQVARMSRDRRAKQAPHFDPGERGKRRPRMNKLDNIREDMRGLGLTWEDALVETEDRGGWRICIARCLR